MFLNKLFQNRNFFGEKKQNATPNYLKLFEKIVTQCNSCRFRVFRIYNWSFKKCRHKNTYFLCATALRVIRFLESLHVSLDPQHLPLSVLVDPIPFLPGENSSTPPRGSRWADRSFSPSPGPNLKDCSGKV